MGVSRTLAALVVDNSGILRYGNKPLYLLKRQEGDRRINLLVID